MSTLLDKMTRPEPERDRWGRYLIVPPEGGKPRSWTRVTTLAETLDDRWNLERWKLRQASVGLVARPDLLAMVAAHRDDKKRLDKIVDDAMEAAKASSGANLGTALHAMTEQSDLGIEVPEGPWTPDVNAYDAAMRHHGVTIAKREDGVPLIEAVVVNAHLDVAGTTDRIVEIDGHWYIADLKTGASAVEWGLRSIAIQLACYARATSIYDYSTKLHHPMPPVDLERALVIHLPVGEHRCELVWVDIAAGWEAAQLAVAVRRWRSRNDLQMTAPSVPSLPTDGAEAGVERPGATGAPLAPADLRQWGRDHATDDGADVDEATMGAVKAAYEALDPEQRAVIGAWVREARAAELDWAPKNHPTLRRFELMRAALALVAVGDDDVVRHLIGVIVGDGLAESVPTGAWLGSLNADEAWRLEAITRTYLDGAQLGFDDHGRPQVRPATNG